MNIENCVIRKINEDDMLEILTERYMDSGFTGTARGLILGAPGVDLRFIGVWGQGLFDEVLDNMDLNKLEKDVDFDSSDVFLEKDPRFYASVTPTFRPNKQKLYRVLLEISKFFSGED